MRTFWCASSLAVLLTAAFPAAQQPTPGQPVPDDQQEQDQPGGRGGAQAREPQPRPYDRVITREAKSDDGVFTVHRIRDRIYYEIPKGQLGKEFLWVTQIARTTIGQGQGGQAAGNRVVKWVRRENRVLLKNVAFDIVADPKLPIAKAVDAANYDTIIMSFNVEAFGKDDSAVIDVTRLFTTDVPEYSAGQRIGGGTFDTTRAFVERAVSFPTNIEVEATHTFVNRPGGAAGGGRGPAPAPAPGGRGRGTPARVGSASVLMHYSMLLLPEQPMQPRLFDDRVGYFSISQMDYGQDEHRAPRRRYIVRYRLEKKDPRAALSEPVKPIVYWIDPATPSKWVPWLKKGVEDWQPAFEAAGFKNAIIAKEAPTPQEDPDWSPEDARYSVIRWLPSTTENASGPNVHDPRTGEIFESDIQFYHNVMNLARDWYFVQVGPLDLRAKTLPLPDDLMGRLLEYVVAHEIGHTLGFQHNMKSSSTYAIERVRDAAWVKKMGHSPSIMDYSRFNYVAQPEDKIDPADLIPRVGPYDTFATMWGYKPVDGASTPDAEKKTLDEWARQQDATPWYRFSTTGSRGTDPGDLTEAVGDGDAVAATTLGIKNLRRVSDMLLSATTTRAGEPYDDLGELYGRMLGQWATELTHVTQIVGGFSSQEKYVGQDGLLFQPVSRERQVAAVKFLNDNAFQPPAWAIRPDILRRIEPVGVLDRVRTNQQRVLNSLLSAPRLARLVEEETIDGKSAYAAVEFLRDVRTGIWRELAGAQPVKVDAYRRNLQRAYVQTLGDRVSAKTPATDDSRALFRGELRAVDAEIKTALARTTDRLTRLHLEDVRDQIAKALGGKNGEADAAAAPSTTDAWDDGYSGWILNCWKEEGR
jgi:uncharacterized protein (UPF0262 family)